MHSTPIVEAGFTGAAIGAALTGMRPVVEVGNGCFIMRAYDEVTNEAAQYRYICGAGSFKLPMVIGWPISPGSRPAAGLTTPGAQESRFIGSPGLKVVIPSTPGDAKGLLKTAIREDNPVLFFEHKMLYNITGDVPSDSELYAPDRAGGRAPGRDGRFDLRLGADGMPGP